MKVEDDILGKWRMAEFDTGAKRPPVEVSARTTMTVEKDGRLTGEKKSVR